MGDDSGWSQFFSVTSLWLNHMKLICLWTNSLSQSGKVAGLQGRQSWVQNPDLPCAETCIFLLMCGNNVMLRNRPVPVAFWLSQPSSASRRVGRLGMAEKQFQASGPTSPRARMWRETQAGGGSHRSAPVLTPKRSRPRQPLSAGGGGERLQLPGSRPWMRTRAALQAPTSDIYCPPGQLPVALQSSLALHREEHQGLTIAGPAWVRLSPVLPDQPASISHVPRTRVDIITNVVFFNPQINMWM